MDDRLRPLWNFDDLDGTETRLRAQLEANASDASRAEVLTQLARVSGLRGDFVAGDAFLDEAATIGGDVPIVTARLNLERGRLRRSSGDPVSARPLFEAAFAVALEERQHFIAADAAHMVALVAPGRDDIVDWTRRGIELAELHGGAAYWLGPLLNNLGWEYYEADELEPALDAFERALEARERDPDDPAAIEIARYAVGKTLRELGRASEAIPVLERATAWAAAEGAPDGWFHEELAEEYAAVGRLDDAREQALLAVPILERDDPSFAADDDRRGRLDALADP